ncbi:hypothetical protein AB2B38_004340 [Balneola sp. MJW-20]|uniref:hypothetical protein n=1 Tax=Gracilimonas aurantiaca TaxID=3234185 RepID=UPI003465E1A4
MKRFKLVPLVFLIAISLNACLETDPIELEKRVVVEYTFSGLNNIYTSPTDTIEIESVRMFVPRFWVITTNDDSLNSNVPFVFSYSQADLDNPKEIVNANVGFGGLEDYDDFRMQVQLFSAESGISDNTLANEGNPLSFSIAGRYNGEIFRYNSQYEFDRSISYTEINLTDRQETMILTLIGNSAEWFADPSQSGALLSPIDPGNQNVINQQFEESFSIASERTTALED